MSIFDNLSELGKIVAKFAPLLGSILPIPGGAAIGTIIAHEFGGNIDNPKDLANLIQADPDAAIKLKAIESNQRIEVERLAIDRLRASNEESANARQREIEISKIPENLRDRTPAFLAKVFISGYFILAFYLVTAMWLGTIDPNEQKTIIEMLKEQSMAVMLILAYYYGASNRR